MMKMLSAKSALEVFYQERELTEVQKILMSPDRSPNFRGARDMGVSANGGYESLLQMIGAGEFSSCLCRRRRSDHGERRSRQSPRGFAEAFLPDRARFSHE